MSNFAHCSQGHFSRLLALSSFLVFPFLFIYCLVVWVAALYIYSVAWLPLIKSCLWQDTKRVTFVLCTNRDLYNSLGLNNRLFSDSLLDIFYATSI